MGETEDRSLDEVFQGYAERGARAAMLGLADIDGVLRGKFVSLDKLKSLLRHGGGFCDCVFGWDVEDELYEHAPGAAWQGVTGWDTGFPDADYRLLTATERRLPGSEAPFFLGEFASEAGDHPACPRSLLRRVLARAESLGLVAQCGFEYEFFVFKETPDSVRAKGYRDLVPVTPGSFGYSVLRAAAQGDLFQELMAHCADLSMPLEGLHCETGPGVWEGALASADALEAADRAVLFKTFAKTFFQQREMMATFMAKWSMDYPGQSGHFHFSFHRADSKEESDPATPSNVFAGDDIPDTARWALGGLMQHTPELLPMLAPTVNSFTRLVKGAWAPTASTWGIENRTAAFRFIPGSRAGNKQFAQRTANASAWARQHIECRVGGADGNPYLAAAAAIGAALLGIEERLEPGNPVQGNAYDAADELPPESRFSPTLREAAERFAASGAARELFGNTFVDHFAATRTWEAERHERHVDSWQLARYFEII